METTRFAPSPTGRLHLGHAYAAGYARNAAKGGTFLLRIEDIEADRVRDHFTEAIFEDLRWLGLDWASPVLFQSARLDAYRAALERLAGEGLAYPCFCSRRELSELSAPHGDLGPVYPGRCRRLEASERADRMAAGEPFAWRLDVGQARQRSGPLTWRDRRRGPQTVPDFGDPVIARKDIPTSYHLSATVDDAWQNITLVTRGDDLFPSTHVHRLLQALLGLPTPEYDHHPLVTDAEGNRLSKRDGSIAISAMRESGMDAEAVWRRVGLEPR